MWLPVAAILALAVGACGDSTSPSTEGAIQVTVATTGSEVDPDGYTVLVDGDNGQPVGSDGSVTFSSIQAGTREVSLTGIAANCSVTGTHPRSVTVTAEETAQVTFDVVCTASSGDLTVSTTTTGDNIDADGFTFSVDGGTAQAIGVNESVTIQVDAGTRSVELSGLAANCTVSGENPRTVTVPQNGAVQTDFTIDCEAIVGSVEVVTSTTGDNIDSDGFTVAVEGATPVAIGVVDTVLVSNVPYQNREVELQGVADNCSVVNGTNPRTVTVPENSTVSTTFVVSCSTTLGDINITTSTTGTQIDPDGYMVAVEGKTPASIGTDDMITVTGVAAGMRTVELTEVADNCSVTDNPRTITVPDGGSVDTTFDVVCVPSLTDKIVFRTDRDGNEEIYVMGTDGSSPTNLTNNANADKAPHVSPDGTKIVFVSDRGGSDDIWVMDADGGNPMQLTTDPDIDDEPNWSPDGTQIVFSSDRDGDFEVFTMNADGSSETQRTFEAGRDGLPDWSPDGLKIAFTTERAGGDLDIWVMDADGGNPTAITDNATHDFGPAWSPDGLQIAFTAERDGNREIYTMDANGNNQINRSQNAAADLVPDWSPDGSMLSFSTSRDGNSEIYTMTSSGASPINRTNHLDTDFDAAWSP
jgi:hypothetical protein